MKESNFWKDLKEGLHSILASGGHTPLYTHRIENGAGRGQPDVVATFDGREIWLELKVMKGRQIEIRHSQLAWLRNRVKSGMDNTFIVALDKKEIKVWRGKRMLNFMVTGTNPRRVTEKSTIFVPPSPNLICEKDPHINWIGLRTFLFDAKYETLAKV